MRVRVSAWLSVVVVATVAATLPSGPTTAQPAASKNADGAPHAIIVLDASGSMLAPVGGRPKIAVAREAMGDLLKGWDPKVEVGLMAYGHRRKNDCSDIELLVPAGRLDAARVMTVVGGIQPRGMTPLSEAVRQAAQSLRFTEQSATVILISDGIETCKADPCAVGAELKKLGVDFRTHVIGFNVQRQDEGGLRCLARATGGTYFSAKDAAALHEALTQAGRATAAPTPPPAPARPAPNPALPKATLTAPASVTAGSALSVAWTGPNAKGDYIAFVAPGTEGDSGNMTETAAGNPTPLRAPDKPGRYDIVYGNAAGKALARQPIDVTPAPATLEAVETITIGGTVDIGWTGPSGPGDFITIVPPTADRSAYRDYADTRNGSPARVRVPDKADTYEIRYVTGETNQILARRTVVAVPAQVELQAVDSAPAGSRIKVVWTGPNNTGDFITLVKPDAAKSEYTHYFNTRDASPDGQTLRLPDQVGTYELRYVTGQSNQVLARHRIVAVATQAAIEAAASGPAGARIKVRWTGPNGDGDFITVVRPDEPKSAYSTYFSTRDADPDEQTLKLPGQPGGYELRYVTGQSNEVLVRKPITVTAVTATLEAPASAPAGARIRVTWTGPNNEGDFITVVRPDAEKSAYSEYFNTNGTEPEDGRLVLPADPGAYELRYVTSDSEVLARRPIEVR